MRPLRILLASSERGWYGGERQARLLARGLRERGHWCGILARGSGETARRLAAEGFEVFPRPGSGNSPSGWLRARRQIARIRPDLLHANDPRALTGPLLASLGLRGTVRLAARRVAFPLRSPRAYRALAQRVICVSEAVRKRCQADGLPPELLRVVFDGVDCNALDAGNPEHVRSALAVPAGSRLALAVGSLVPSKGHAVLLEAMVRLSDRSAAPIILAIAGSGPLDAELRTAAQRLGLHDRVRFLGYREDVPDLLAAADVFVMPSLEEGLGSAALEAACAGVPVVASRAGGLPEALGSVGAAGLVEPGDANALARAVLTVLDRGAASAPTVAAVRQRARDRFGAGVMVSGTLAVYEELLASRREG